MALLWMGADPYVLDSYGNTPKTTAEAFDHLKIAVGLQAVAKKETELAQALNVYDEVERGVERAEAFRVAVCYTKLNSYATTTTRSSKYNYFGCTARLCFPCLYHPASCSFA